MTRSGPTGLSSDRRRPAILESGCYWAEAEALGRNNAPQCRNPSGKRSGNSPCPTRPRLNWPEAPERFRPPAAPLHAARVSVEESARHIRVLRRMTAAPRQGQTLGLTAPLL